jgi:hypothetical protein
MHNIPLLPLFALLPVAAVLCGLGRRVAGGGFTQWTGINLGDLPVRLFFGLMIAVVGLLAGLAWPRAAALIVAGWIGTTIPNFGGIALGRSGNPWFRDAEGLAAHGLIGMAVLALFIAAYPLWPLSGFGPLYVVGMTWGGTAIVPAYWIGWSVAGKSGNESLPVGFRGGSEIGECLWGAAVGLVVALALSLPF